MQARHPSYEESETMESSSVYRGDLEEVRALHFFVCESDTRSDILPTKVTLLYSTRP